MADLLPHEGTATNTTYIIARVGTTGEIHLSAEDAERLRIAVARCESRRLRQEQLEQAVYEIKNYPEVLECPELREPPDRDQFVEFTRMVPLPPRRMVSQTMETHRHLRFLQRPLCRGGMK